LFPREVVIDKGGTVTFVMGASFTRSLSISREQSQLISLLEPPAATCPPVPKNNDPNHRVAIRLAASPRTYVTSPPRSRDVCRPLATGASWRRPGARVSLAATSDTRDTRQK
jgi:hypothetical protein